MKTIILCGGTGTRMKEETEFKPKPLVLVGGKPILWHIMKIYAHYGYNDFILALGYKGSMIKDYFLNWQNSSSDFTVNTKTNEIIYHNNQCDEFKITFVETGSDSLTGERVKRCEKYLDDGSDHFMVTYGDGVGDIDIKKLVDFHIKQNTCGTITGVRPSNRFGFLNIDENTKKAKDFFQHKITMLEASEQAKDHVNGGFMVFKKEIIDQIPENSMVESVFAPLAQKGEISVYTHSGKWKCMDTHKEVEELNEMWSKDPFWKVWN
ncbi:MAG: sugar phosphate nucleotidyltransferase [Candidatus Magasanikbacteria bacterium]